MSKEPDEIDRFIDSVLEDSERYKSEEPRIPTHEAIHEFIENATGRSLGVNVGPIASNQVLILSGQSKSVTSEIIAALKAASVPVEIPELAQAKRPRSERVAHLKGGRRKKRGKR